MTRATNLDKPEMLAASAVALAHPNYAKDLADAWLIENAGLPGAEEDVADVMDGLANNGEVMRDLIRAKVRRMGPIGRVRFAVAFRQQRRRARLL